MELVSRRDTEYLGLVRCFIWHLKKLWHVILSMFCTRKSRQKTKKHIFRAIYYLVYIGSSNPFIFNLWCHMAIVMEAYKQAFDLPMK
jgi:hypothetical protein